MPNDLISRRAAIDEIDEWIKAFLEQGHKESAADACLIQDGIIQLPSAQPSFSRDQENDPISRRAAVDHFRDIIEATDPKEPYNEGFVDGLEFCISHLSTMPSVMPKEQKWIPCYPSELPKNMPLWATFDNGDGYRYVETVFWDMTEWNMDVSNVIAYMPYEEPEPYREEGRE